MSLRLLGAVLRRRAALRRRDRWTRAQLEAYQGAALRELRTYAYARSPFYRRFHRGLETRPLDDLPVLTKAELMSAFDELVTDPDVRLADVARHVTALTGDALFLGRYRVVSTSGSTGLRGLFLAEDDEWATVLASYARAMDWAGAPFRVTRCTRLAVVSSRLPWHQSARVGASVRNPMVRTLRLDAAAPVEDIVAELNRFGPDRLVGYASAADQLAGEQVAGRLHIAPDAVFCASEPFTDEMRRRVARAFGPSVFNVYAATETAGIASECRLHSGLHLYEDLVIAEAVDDRYRPVPAGEPGTRLLVSVLFSRTQPLIRYELTDQVRLARESCRCGRPFRVVAEVQGRAEDVLEFDVRGGGRVAIHPNVLHAVLESAPVTAWQVVQESGGLRLLVVGAAPGFDPAALAGEVTRALESRGVAGIPVAVEHVAEIPRGPTGKVPALIRRGPRPQ